MKMTRRVGGGRSRLLTRFFGAGFLAVAVALTSVYAYAGVYGLNILFRHGGTWWVGVGTNSAWLSPSMRLSLDKAPIATPGALQWRTIAEGFEVADLVAIVDGHDVDQLQLSRIDPARFRFEVRVAHEGNVGLDQWMARLHPALLVEGSYSGLTGWPVTPVVSEGHPLGPAAYEAKAGAFVASSSFTGVRDLSHIGWQEAFRGSDNAMVSFPMLVADGKPGPVHSSRWLANRNFVGQDRAGRVIIGTTMDAFFPLERFAQFLLSAPLDLTFALNLDGGPVASQGISLNGFERRTYGRWEAKVEGNRAKLLMWPYGTVSMPVVLAVFPR